VTSSDDRSCENCVAANFGQFGIYCSTFNEHIYLPVTVARDCSEYEPVTKAAKKSVNKPHLEIVPPEDIVSPTPVGVSRETDRVLHVEMDLPYFGKDAHGDRLFDALERIVTLHWPKASLHRKEL
jgi:hypothetical protein